MHACVECPVLLIKTEVHEYVLSDSANENFVKAQLITNPVAQIMVLYVKEDDIELA